MVTPRRSALLVLALAVVVVAPRCARAHFALRFPASWRTQTALGDPQKVGPCGDEGTAEATGAVTAFSSGETITITLDETIFHPGHYRVALAVQDRSELPPEPPVTPGATACGSVPIMTPAVFPVLADGALLHTAVFSGTQAIEVTLPSDVTCTHCTLQVLEFMSSHSEPCFYHHCADISIGVGPDHCETDAECVDASVCTSDHCNLATNTCEHSDTVTPTCDDGNACTRDTCDAAQGCGSQPLTLADVNAGFLGVLPGPPCSPEPLPPVIGTLFGRAETFVTRAAQRPAKAARFLRQASRKLHRAVNRLAKARERSISEACATALDAVFAQAQSNIECLRGGL